MVDLTLKYQLMWEGTTILANVESYNDMTVSSCSRVGVYGFESNTYQDILDKIALEGLEES